MFVRRLSDGKFYKSTYGGVGFTFVENQRDADDMYDLDARCKINELKVHGHECYLFEEL